VTDPIDIPAKVAAGIALFNAGDYFEAHEAWEDAWHATRGRTKATLQVLIQLAVAMEHHRRGNRVGAKRMIKRAQRRLEALREVDRRLPSPAALMRQVRASIEAGVPNAPRIPPD